MIKMLKFQDRRTIVFIFFFSNLETLQCIECFISYVATSKINDHDHHLVRHLIIFTTIFGTVPLKDAFLSQVVRTKCAYVF